jgi:hypothetical protein
MDEMDKREARRRLRQLLAPIRDRVEAEFDMPDLKDALLFLEAIHWDSSELFGEEASQDLSRMVEQAGWSQSTLLGDVFLEEQ